MRKRITKLGDGLLRHRSWAVTMLQACIILFSLVLAWLLRLDFSWGDKLVLFSAAPILIISRLITMRIFGLQHGWWQYTGINEAFDITKAVACGSILFYLVLNPVLGITQFPRSIYLLEAMLTAALLMGVRVFSRALAESVREDLGTAKRVLIIGAGFAAQMLLREIRRPGSEYKAVGCVDDDPTKQKIKILGVSVIGTVDQIPELASKFSIDEVLIAIPSANNTQMRRFVDVCEQAKVKFRTIPALKDFLLGQEALSQVRDVNLDDLLGREPVRIDLESVRQSIQDRVILVTGAAGSIGSEICHQILDFNPSKLICLDQSETGIFYLQLALDKLKTRAVVETVVGDFNDHPMVRSIMLQNAVEVIFHAAAYKHVPVMENNVAAAVKNNVFGLVSLLDLAEESGCESFILISSDKAVNPTSVMGATKRIGELIIAARPVRSLRCVSVRFGNVLGSNGSLIPILQEQLKKGVPLTITDPEIRRFFMTTQEAVSLVLQAFIIGLHRDILVLDMGDSLRILDIAKTLIKLSGKSESSVKIEFTGLRSGEKFYEELFYESEQVLPSSFEQIKRTKGSILNWPELKQSLEHLRLSVELGIPDGIRESIREVVPEYDYSGPEPMNNEAAADESRVAYSSEESTLYSPQNGSARFAARIDRSPSS